MINFRYHLASLIAVFLALALGIVMGSTVIDRAIVDSLRNRIDRVENNAEKRQRENRSLEQQVSELNDYIDATTSYVVTGRLGGVPVAVLAFRDSQNVSSATDILKTAGALVTDIVWFTEKLTLDNESDVQELAAIVGIASEDPDEVRVETAQLVSDRVARGSGGSDDILTRLAGAGFVEFEHVSEAEQNIAVFPGSNARSLVVVDPDMESGVINYATALVSALSNRGMLTTVGESFDSTKKDRGDVLAQVVGDNNVSSVSNIENRSGQVAAVLALADLSNGVTGKFGAGGGAQQPIPEFVPG